MFGILPNSTFLLRSLSSSSETLNNIDEDQDILELHAAIKVHIFVLWQIVSVHILESRDKVQFAF